jgi:multiple sugar transport system substrate-binding protein
MNALTTPTTVVPDAYQATVTRRDLVKRLGPCALASSLIYTACRAPDRRGAPEPQVQVKETSLWVYDAFEPLLTLRQDLDRLVYTPFAQKYPQIKVQHDSVSTGDFYAKVPVLFASGKPPDVLWVQTFVHYTYIEQNLALDLMPLIARDKQLNLPDFWPKALASLRKGGGLYGLPYSMQTLAVYYNRQLFREAGLTFPKDSWTWQEFLETAMRLTQVEGGEAKRFGGGPVWPTSWMYESFLLHAGGSILNKERNAPTLTSPGSLHALEWSADFYLKYRVAPNKLNPLPRGLGFKTGHIAMMVNDLPVREDLNRLTPPLDYDVVRLPKGPLNNLSVTGGGAYWISAQTKAPYEAFLLFSALLSKEAAPAYGLSGIPGRRSASDLIKVPGQPPERVQVFLDAMQDAPSPTWAEHRHNLKLWQACAQPLDAAFHGDLPLREGIAQAQQVLEKVLAEQS